MNKKTIDTIFKWTLRFYYTRMIIGGIIGLCFCFTLLLTDYEISEKENFNTFVTIISGMLGLILLILGLVNKVETEKDIRNKLHERDIE